MTDLTQRKALRDYHVPPWSEDISCIQSPPISARSFKVKSGLIKLIQASYSFGGLPHEDPNEHIMQFIEVCKAQRYDAVSAEALWLLLFPFSIKGKART
jgi:hypothetical protein